jgi:hypothetical protein
VAPQELPPEAGPIVFDLRKIRPLRIALLVTTISILIGLALSDRKLVPIAGMIVAICALIGGVGGVIKYFITKLCALCEHGVVTKKAARFAFVPWSAVAGVERQAHEGHVTYAIHTDRGPLMFYPGALGNAGTRRALAFIDQRRAQRGRTAARMTDRSA